MKNVFMGLICLLMSMLYAQVDNELTHNIDTPFDVNDIIGQVSNNTSTPQYGNMTQPLLDPGFLLDTNFVYGPIAYYAYLGGIASNGTNYLVVWYDIRDLTANLYAARVDTAGILLDSVGIAVSLAPGFQHYPSVASDGSDYLVVWCDYRSGNYDIYGARVTTDGAVLDPDGFPICTATGTQRDPRMSFDGTNYMVVWEDNRVGNNDIYGARIDISGTVLNEFAICNAAQNQQDPAISFNGADYLVAWQDYRNGSNNDVYAQCINTGGGLIGEDFAVCVDSTSRAYYPAVTNDGANYLIVWYDNRTSNYYDIYGARVNAEGTVIDTNGFAISALPSNYQYNPQVAFDGTNYFVVWHDRVSGSPTSYDLYGVHVDTSGTVLDTTAIIEEVGYQYYAQLVFDGTNYMVVWRDNGRTTSYNVCGLRVDPSGTVLDPGGFLISMAPYIQYRPALSFDGTNYLIVWEDYRNDFTNQSDIYGARVDVMGTILDPNGIAICTAGENQQNPKVAFDGTNYFVVWFDYRNYADVYGQFVSTTGALIGNEVPVCTTEADQYDINMGYGGGKYLVVWHDRGDFWNWQIYGQFVDTSGQLAGPEIHITNEVDWRYEPSVAFDGTNFMVVWEDDRSGAVRDIYAARVDTSGTVLDTSGIEIVVNFATDYKPAIAFDGTNYLVVYGEFVPTGIDIYAKRVDTSGVVLDTIGIVICEAPGDRYPYWVAFCDTNYVVVWDDYRDLAGIDVYGAIVNRSGTVIDSFAISPPGNQLFADLASGQGDQALIAYSGWVDSLGGRLAQTMRIWYTWAPVFGIEELTDVIPQAELRLHCYPNPFSRATEIRYELAETGMQDFSLTIYDVSGRLVRQFDHLANKPVNTIFWDGKDNTGRNLPAGVYFAQLRTDRLTNTEKIIKLK